MNIALWIAAGLLAAVNLTAGVLKTTQPRERLQPNLPWVEDVSDPKLRFIGTVELLGATGLILPWALSIARVLTPLAATGIAVLQVLAVLTHVRREEKEALPINGAILAVAAFVAIGRFTGLG